MQKKKKSSDTSGYKAFDSITIVIHDYERKLALGIDYRT